MQICFIWCIVAQQAVKGPVKSQGKVKLAFYNNNCDNHTLLDPNLELQLGQSWW